MGNNTVILVKNLRVIVKFDTPSTGEEISHLVRINATGKHKKRNNWFQLLYSALSRCIWVHYSSQHYQIIAKKVINERPPKAERFSSKMHQKEGYGQKIIYILSNYVKLFKLIFGPNLKNINCFDLFLNELLEILRLFICKKIWFQLLDILHRFICKTHPETSSRGDLIPEVIQVCD